MTFTETLNALDGGYEIRECTFTEDAFAGTAAHLIFHGVTFQRCRFSGADLSSSEFSNCRFVGCDLSNCRFAEGFFSHVHFENTKAVGADFTRCVLRDVAVTDAAFRFANFGGTKWDHVTVRDSSFAEASLTAVTLRHVTFTDCDLTRAELFRTPLRGIDLRTDIIRGITVSDHFGELRGAIVDEMQAVELARFLGVEIK